MNIGSILRRAFGAFSRRKTRTGPTSRGMGAGRSNPKAQAAKGVARTISKKM